MEIGDKGEAVGKSQQILFRVFRKGFLKKIKLPRGAKVGQKARY